MDSEIRFSLYLSHSTSDLKGAAVSTGLDGIDSTVALKLRDDKGQLHRCHAGDVTIEKPGA